jgi:hypothetical protein
MNSLVSLELELKNYYAATIDDVFRKIDLQMNGILSARELNQFGNLVNEDKFKNIEQEDFESEEFENVSCTEEGLTQFGFKQYLFHNFSQKEISDMLLKLGYDDGLNSLKSRVFVVTFHSSEPLTVTIHDVNEGDMHKTASNMYMDKLLEDDSVRKDDKNEHVTIIKKHHKEVKSYSFAALNKTEDTIKVEFDLNKSSNYYFSPQCGKITKIVKPDMIEYLSSASADK